MQRENRQDTRYKEIGRVIAVDLCPISAILDDISVSGCKIHYSFPLVVDLEEEYNLKITALHFADMEPLHLLCKPQWVSEKDGCTFVGFSILYSPDSSRLGTFIDYLEKISQDTLPDID